MEPQPAISDSVGHPANALRRSIFKHGEAANRLEYKIENCGKKKNSGRYDGCDKNCFFNSPSRAIKSSLAAKHRRKTAAPLLQEDGCDKDNRRDNLNYLEYQVIHISSIMHMGALRKRSMRILLR